MSWWTPTKCHIQTVIINLNLQRHGIYISNSINKMFPLCLIVLFYFKDCKVFLMHRVYWCEIMASEKVSPIILVSLDTSHTNLTTCDDILCSSMGFSTFIVLSIHLSNEIQPNFTFQQDDHGVFVFHQHTCHNTANSQNSVLLHNLCFRVCELQMCCVDMLAAVLLHLVLMT